MRIKSNTRIATISTAAAEELGMKPSRYGWGVRQAQAERLARLLEAEDRVSTRKVKQGKQAIAGRTRVERVNVKEVEVEMEVVDNRPRHWGVVCCTADGECYVTTASEQEGRMDLNSVAVLYHTDRIVGVMGFWQSDLRFAPSDYAHRDWAETESRSILGWSTNKEYYFYRK